MARRRGWRLDDPALDGRSRTTSRMFCLGFAGLFAALSLVPWFAESLLTAWASSLVCLACAGLFLIPAVFLNDAQLDRLGWFFRLFTALAIPIRLLLLLGSLLWSLLS